MGLVLLALILLAGNARADNSAPRAQKDFNARCRERFDRASIELKNLGQPTVQARPGERHSAAIGTVRLTMAHTPGLLTAELRADDSPTLYRGEREVVPKNYQSWHSAYDDSIRRPDDARQTVPLFEERHHPLGIAPGAVRGLILGASNDAVAQQFAAIMKHTIDQCLAEIRPDAVDPTMAWRRQCREGLEATRRQLALREPAFAAGEVEIQSTSVWLNDPRDDASPSFSAAAVCGQSPAPRSAWHEGNLFDASRVEGHCTGLIRIRGATDAVHALAVGALERSLDACMAAGRDF